ncbi:hypothetical protein TrVE_jg4901 [Triparma verrucosa]|uniref:Calmodulin n=2 Tax=Triparma TaxID=722752 RepID=A0A9W7BAU7_9STRA|nr:hypothetical protein TrST_g432 [Triparma strigata]GMH94407.1 hypothetical protein TrVE_jg4901 [Triparma verrucosa]
MSAPVHPTGTEDGGSSTSPWTSSILLGPAIPSVLSLVTVVFGQFTLLADEVCSDPMKATENAGCAFMRGSIVVAFLELIIFCWVFMGTTVSIKLGTKSFRILRPFSKLRTIAICYFLLYLVSLGVFAGGLMWLVDFPESGAVFLGFVMFLQVSYWLMFVFIIIALVKIKLKQRTLSKSGAKYSGGGGGQRATIRQTQKVGTEDWFREIFEEESDGMDTLEVEKLAKLFEKLGLDVPEEEITAVTDVLDLEGTGEVGFTATWSWYTKTGKSFRKEADMKVEDIEDGDKDKDE